MLIEMNNMNKSKLTVVASCIGIFLCMLDTTIMNIALPAIQTGLNVNLNDLSWALNIYTILFATLTIPLSKLSEKLGMHKFYVGGMIIFLLGSLISAFSSNITILIFGRAFQSLGAAVVFPLSMTIGISTVEISDRTKVICCFRCYSRFSSCFRAINWWGANSIFIMEMDLSNKYSPDDCVNFDMSLFFKFYRTK